MRRRRIAVVSFVLATLGGLAIAVAAYQPSLPDTARHVQSRITSMARFGADDDPTWVYITSNRDIWILPDGSGRIAEQPIKFSFPTPAEEAEWLADPGGYDGVNETFPPGELYYVRAVDVRSGVTDFGMRFAPGGDALRRLASLLAETVPSREVAEAALATAVGLNGVRVERLDGRVTVSSLTGTGELEVTLIFGTSPTHLVRESWHAQQSRPGLDVRPPYLIFDREVLLSETLTAG
jgi:hypothetical protein